MKKTKYSLLFILCAGLFACDKQNTLPEHYSIIPSGNTNVKFLIMSPDAPPINFFANNAKVTGVPPSATNAVQGMIFPQLYPANTAYTTFTAGSVKLDAKVPDSSATMAGQTILSLTQTFAPNKFYTVAVFDSLSKIASVVVEDDPSVPNPTTSYFRLANFVSNSPSIKIEFVKTSSGTPFTLNFPNVAYKSISTFDTLSAGSGQVYKIYLKNPATDAKLDSISAFTPSQSKKYTIYARGVMGLPVSNTKRPIITNYVNF